MCDLRAGSIHDAFAYDNPITSMMFDARRIAAAAGEPVAKIYDKTDERRWDYGARVIAEAEGLDPAAVERLRLKDGCMTEGRKDGGFRRAEPRTIRGTEICLPRFTLENRG